MAFCSACGAEVTDSAEYCNNCGSEISDADSSTKSESDLTYPANDGFAFKHALISALLALIPAIVLSIVVPVPSIKILGFLVGLVGFAYLGYQRPSVKASFGRQSFWTAILLFLSPLMMIIYTFVFASQQADGSAEEAGAAIGGTVLVILAFVVGLPLGIAFYVMYKKFDIEQE